MIKTTEKDQHFLFFLGDREGFKVQGWNLEDDKTTTKLMLVLGLIELQQKSFNAGGTQYSFNTLKKETI
jgi:hypothetical protein